MPDFRYESYWVFSLCCQTTNTEGWMFVLIGIISVISGVILYKKGKDTSDASPIFIMLYGIGFISLLSFGVGITRVLNPEYSAVMGILEMMKQ